LADREYINWPDASRLVDPQFLRNNLRSAGDGFAWPDFAIIPGGPQTTLSWRPYFSPAARWTIRYIGRGDVAVDSDQLRLVLTHFIEAVISRLDECGIGKTELHREWREICETPPDVAEFCQAAARLGLDPYVDAQDYEKEIMMASTMVPSDMFNDFIESVSPSNIGVASQWLISAAAEVDKLLASSLTQMPDTSFAAQFNRESGSTTGRPWELGWDRARLTRREIKLDPSRKFEPQQYMTIREHGSQEPRIQAIGKGAGRTTAVILGDDRTSERARNFLLARSYLHAAIGDGTRFLITSAYTYKQKIERAFAAELLAPAAGISYLLGDDPWSVSPEEIDRIADHYNVTSQLIKHQIENQLAVIGPS
jgi:hypothetical protein